jgi:hypothetical protein
MDQHTTTTSRRINRASRYARSLALWGAVTLGHVLSGHAAGSERARDDDLRAELESRIEAWEAWMENTHSSELTGCEEFGSLVELGVEAVPLLIERIRSAPRQSTMLVTVVQFITQSSFDVGDAYEKDGGQYAPPVFAAHRCVTWWQKERSATPERFEELYSNWLLWRRAGDLDEAKRARYLMAYSLGLDALPFLIEKIRNGDEAAIVVVSALARGGVRETDTVENILRWWEENHDEFTLPPSGGYDPRKTGINLSLQDSTELPSVNRSVTDEQVEEGKPPAEGSGAAEQAPEPPEDRKRVAEDGASEAQRRAGQGEIASADVEQQPGTQDDRGLGWIAFVLAGGTVLVGLGGWAYARRRRPT